MLEFKYDTQLLIEGEDLDEDVISDYFTEHFKGDCLLAVGDEELIKIHFHTNEPWKVLEYCSTLGEIVLCAFVTKGCLHTGYQRIVNAKPGRKYIVAMTPLFCAIKNKRG